MIPLVDCHAHFYPPNYTLSEIEEHLASQIDGYYLAAVVVTPETLAESETVADLSNRFTQIKSCSGLHPVQHVTSSNDGAVVSVSAHPRQLGGVVEFVRTRALVAVGEIGLDFSPWILESTAKVWGVSVDEVKAEQRRVFSAQIKLAKERGLPVNVHSRNAGHHAIAVLEECGMLDRALLHAFDGAPKHAVRAAQLGALFSVPGSIARDDSTKKLVDKLPLTSLCLESDAPALPPVKGDRTWPLHSLVVSAQHIASIKGVSVEDVARATTENASKFFRLQLKESIS